MTSRFFGYFLVIVLIITGCSQATPGVTSTPKPTGILTPYRTLTPSAVQPTSTIMVVVPETPAPTATPFLHTITNDDTMLGIAYKYGITLEALKAANPGVDPHFMTVGSQLIIPIQEEIPASVPTATPFQVQWSQPRCYQTGDGGAWCILDVTNNLDTNLENLSAWIGLYNTQGENFISQVAYAPLNLLRPGESIPLMAYFYGPLPEKFSAQGQLLSSLAVASDDPRYLDLQAQIEQVAISQDGMHANVGGQVSLPTGTEIPAQLWVLAVGYDAEGNMIGVRKWESQGETKFDIDLYSLGGKIDHVEVLAEARP